MRDETPLIGPTHERIHQLVRRYGTFEEKVETQQVEQLMGEMLEIFPGSCFLPASEIVLPSIFNAQCKLVAQERQKRARRFALENHHGVTRSMEEEIRVAKGQYAACIMLGLPFNKNITHSVAKARGNLGFGISAFIPQPGRYNLIVGDEVPRSRLMVLILDHGANRFEFKGWIRAGAAMLDEYRREFVRNGEMRRPYVVPADYLSPPETWTPPSTD